MPLELIVDHSDGLTRGALVDGNKLVDLAVDRANAPRLYQSIWRVKIDRLLPHVGAFAALGDGRAGLFRDGAHTSGETKLAQIKSLRSDGKADVLTADIALTGRFFVYLPYAAKITVSRKIPAPIFEPVPARLAEHGITGGVIRTAAQGVDAEAIIDEAIALAAAWQTIKSKPGNGLLHEGPAVAERLITDYGAPTLSVRADTFDACGLEPQYQSLFDKTVPLPRGGSVVIESTTALVAIDVNSGSRPAMDANHDAVETIARHIRLRNLSGLILIDFASMGKPALEPVIAALGKAIARDPAGCRLAGVTSSGLVELTRARRDLPLVEKVEGS